jgi:hypothetical protein
MAKTTKAATKPASEGNRYARAARVLARDGAIDIKTLADRAFMSESTAARCREAWSACIAALIEVGMLPDPMQAAGKKATAAKKAPKLATETKPPEATETTVEMPPA